MYNTTYTRRAWINPHRKVQRVRKIIHSPVIISNVYEVVKAFSEEYGRPLSDLEFELFNTIAMTEGNHFHMNYAAKQVKREDMAFTLRQMIKMFSVPLSEDDIAGWIYEIDQNCPDKFKVFPLDTESSEVHRKNKWLTRTEVFIATCGQQNNAGFQLFAWAAYKEGAYKAGQYSRANSQTADALITRWLYSNMRAMIDCERDDAGAVCLNEESSTLSEYPIAANSRVHVGDKDQWQEHANEDATIWNRPAPQPPKPNLSLSDKPIWNKPVDPKAPASPK